MMKKVFFLFMILFSLQISANSSVVDWSQIELYNRYELNHVIEFPSITTFKPGDRFDVGDIVVGGVPVIYFQLHYVDCKDPDLQSEMILINPDPNDQSRDRTVGVQLEEGCNLGVYIEPADIYGKSLFLNLSNHQSF